MIISFHIRAIENCFGIRTIGKAYANIIMILRQQHRTEALVMHKETNCLYVIISILALSVPINKYNNCLKYMYRVGRVQSLWSDNL